MFLRKGAEVARSIITDRYKNLITYLENERS